jgi:hypothetical protein
VRIDSDVVDIPSAGTAVQVLNTRDKIAWIKIKSLAANTGIIYVGDSAVSATNGYELDPGGGIDGELVMDFRPDTIRASDIYVDAATSGNDVSWIAILE